jgi:hypothetical protein
MSVPGLPLGLPGIPGIPGIPNTQSLFSANGVQLGKLSLMLLTIFPPTGYLGLNYSAVGLPATAFIKAIVYGLGIAIGLFANRLYMNEVAKILSYILIFAPPWYIFDCIQIMLDSSFNKNGFLLPLPINLIPSGGGKNGLWTLTFPLLSLILAATSFSGLAFVMKYLPSGITNTIGQYTAYATAGGGALFILVAGIGLLMQKPAVATSASSLSPAAISDANPLGSLGALATGAITGAMKGGGNKSSLPPLSSFINTIRAQSGGSKEDVPFLGILALIILGGFSLNFLRSKQ